MQKTSRRILSVGLPLAAVAVTGAAVAYWTGSGSGSGSASSAPGVAALALTPVTGISGLVPGGAVTVPILATNGNATTSVTLTTLSATPGTLTSGSAACDAVSGATVSVRSPESAVVVAPGGGTAAFGSISITMADEPTVNQDDCKGRTFTVALTAS